MAAAKAKAPGPAPFEERYYLAEEAYHAALDGFTPWSILITKAEVLEALEEVANDPWYGNQYRVWSGEGGLPVVYELQSDGTWRKCTVRNSGWEIE